MALPKWLEILKLVGPQILLFTPLAPIAGAVRNGIAAAEQIPGATGEQKKAIVLAIVAMGAQAVNAQTGKPVLDAGMTTAVAGGIIDSVVGIVNLAHGPVVPEGIILPIVPGVVIPIA